MISAMIKSPSVSQGMGCANIISGVQENIRPQMDIQWIFIRLSLDML